jgi:hypothetical protein
MNVLTVRQRTHWTGKFQGAASVPGERHAIRYTTNAKTVSAAPACDRGPAPSTRTAADDKTPAAMPLSRCVRQRTEVSIDHEDDGGSRFSATDRECQATRCFLKTMQESPDGPKR